MPEPDCFLQYRISAAMRNFTYGKSHVYVLATHCCSEAFLKMVLFTEPSKHLCWRYMRSTECPSSSFIHLYLCLWVTVSGMYLNLCHRSDVFTFFSVNFSAFLRPIILVWGAFITTVTNVRTAEKSFVSICETESIIVYHCLSNGQNINLPVCLCPSHFLSARLQVRPLNGFLQLMA